ncbi:uncharacterized protein B0P05DRAFT_635860 [Gilbertella persicaria]|uniref:uncharacterized protein n=1 Tax=Gilbertella persicaria TaxID=101096 RepID=UPI00221F8B00|nr:uncharacterized protein B0P05DRAFT_635860 [Gilbertella persicaria]KAI8085912.1 hypothetical protein B0P05DRAFT_635860 [Gilbertella persicaria]
MLPIESKKEKQKEIILSLHWACTTGNVGLVKFALDHGVPIDSVVNGFVPLQLACISDNNIAVVQYLIDRGADVNIQKWSKKHSMDKSQAVHGATGSTALHVACANGCTRIVDLLLRNNARADAKDKYGSTPLSIAQAKNEVEIIKLLKAAKKKHRKSLDANIMTHKRTPSDKLVRIRRPSLPSIFEGPPSFISMTPVTPSEPPSRRSFTSTHRPSSEDLHAHSCPVTPRTSIDQLNNNTKQKHKREKFSHSSEELSDSPQTTSLFQLGMHSDGSSSAITTDSHTDWYGYGIVNPYHEENYLQSLEKRAFNLERNHSGHAQEVFKQSIDHQRRPSNELSGSLSQKSSSTLHLEEDYEEENDDYDDDDDDDEDDEEEVVSPSIITDNGKEASLIQYHILNQDTKPHLNLVTTKETKKGWLSNLNPYSHDNYRKSPSFDTISHFKRKGSHKSAIQLEQDKLSDEDNNVHIQQRNGFFSRWTPSWQRK